MAMRWRWPREINSDSAAQLKRQGEAAGCVLTRPGALLTVSPMVSCNDVNRLHWFGPLPQESRDPCHVPLRAYASVWKKLRRGNWRWQEGAGAGHLHGSAQGV